MRKSRHEINVISDNIRKLIVFLRERGYEASATSGGDVSIRLHHLYVYVVDVPSPESSEADGYERERTLYLAKMKEKAKNIKKILKEYGYTGGVTIRNFDDIRNDYIITAQDLLYPKKYQDMLKTAMSWNELNHIMTTARKVTV